MFEDQSILIVEDDYLIAMELVDAIRDLGGTVVGPAPTVAEALQLIDTATFHAAILDVQLIDRDITPVALRLIEMRMPLVIHTGTGLPYGLSGISTGLPVAMKPIASATLLELLICEMKRLSAE